MRNCKCIVVILSSFLIGGCETIKNTVGVFNAPADPEVTVKVYETTDKYKVAMEAAAKIGEKATFMIFGREQNRVILSELESAICDSGLIQGAMPDSENEKIIQKYKDKVLDDNSNFSVDPKDAVAFDKLTYFITWSRGQDVRTNDRTLVTPATQSRVTEVVVDIWWIRGGQKVAHIYGNTKKPEFSKLAQAIGEALSKSGLPGTRPVVEASSMKN